MKTKLLFVLFFFLTILISSNLYPQNSGEIIFSNKLIDPNKPANLLIKFNSGDNIYSVAFLPNTITALSSNKNSKKVNVEVFLYELKPPLYDYQQPFEEQLEFSNLQVSGTALSDKHLLIDIAPSIESITAYGNKDLYYEKFGSDFYGPVKYSLALGKLSTGNHTIIVRININYSPVAEGKFTISGSEFDTYNNLSTQLNKVADNLKTKDAVMPKAEMVDKKLEADMISVIKNSNTYKDRIKGDIIRLVIIDPDWTIRRNELTGVILHRYIRATIAVKNADGSCTVWKLVTFQQDYVGGKFGKTKFDGVGDQYKIPCENVGK
ncbi:MAG: hypothetical protein IPJ23_16300 [Ignavibacteriales bacterium]|nr:hypothetical protein [Ignavibacteriales bacterium]